MCKKEKSTGSINLIDTESSLSFKCIACGESEVFDNNFSTYDLLICKKCLKFLGDLRKETEMKNTYKKGFKDAMIKYRK